MPNYSVGDMVEVDFDVIRQDYGKSVVDAYLTAFGKGAQTEVVAICNDGRVDVFSHYRAMQGRNIEYCRYTALHATFFKKSGPPETVRDMSRRVFAMMEKA